MTHFSGACLLLLALATPPQERPPPPIRWQRLDTDPAGAGVHSSCLPRVAATPDALHAVWQDLRDLEWAVHYRRRDAGGAWSARDVRLSGRGVHAVEPRVVASGRCVHVAWRTIARAGAFTREGVEAISSFDEGMTWTPVATLRPATGEPCDFAGAPDLAADGNGGACAAWVQSIGDRDRALVAVHRGPGAAWPALATIVEEPGESERDGRTAWVRIAAFGRASGAARVAVALAWIADAASATLVVRGSSDAGATFPAELATVLWQGELAGAVELAANAAGALLVAWPTLDAGGRTCLLAQRSDSFGEPRSWLEAPARVDDPEVPRSMLYDAAIAVDAAGSCYAAYAVARPLSRDPSSLAIELVANTLPVDADADRAWSRERVLSSLPPRAHRSFPRMSPRLATATADEGAQAPALAAITWTEDPATSGAKGRVRIGTTADRGVSWSIHALERPAPPDAPRADAADLVLRRDGGANLRAAVVWDDRRFWTPPGAKARSGQGAPESCFLELELPWPASSSR